MNPTNNPTKNPGALLLLPGLMCDAAVWAPLMSHLSPVRTCTVVDHGSAHSLVTMAQQLLAQAPEQFALAGHSMGARVALEVIRLAPQRVQGVALLSTGYTARAVGQSGQEEADKRQVLVDLARTQGVRAMARVWVRGMVHPERLQQHPQDLALVESIVQMFERKSADIFERQVQALLNRPDGSAVLTQLTVPTLVLCGRQDSWAPPDQHQAMHRLVNGRWHAEGRETLSGAPRRTVEPATLAIIEDAGHMAPMEQPAAVANALLHWLGRLQAA